MQEAEAVPEVEEEDEVAEEAELDEKDAAEPRLIHQMTTPISLPLEGARTYVCSPSHASDTDGRK